MKKITLLFFLLLLFDMQAQVCQQTFVQAGPDTSTILTVAADDITCYGGSINSITIVGAHLDAEDESQCENWYTFSLDIDGVVSEVCAEDLLGLVITDFAQLSVTSSDIDEWTDTVVLSLTFAVDYTTNTIPNCDAVLTSPADTSIDVSPAGILTWAPASGGATGYILSVGTTSGGTEVLNSVDVGNVLTYDIPGNLNAGTEYYVTIVAYNSFGNSTGCSESTFTTCGAFEDFTENFTGLSDYELPACWSVIAETDNIFAEAYVYDNSFYLYNSGDAEAELLLVSPVLTALPANTHRLKFSAAGYEGSQLQVGTITDPADFETFTSIQTINLTEDLAVYSVTFNTSTTDQYLAFRHGLSDTYDSIMIDDLIWEPIPSESPDCIGDISVEIDESCGNFASDFSWSHVDGADGYKLKIGTTEGAGDVVDNVDLGFVTSYSFAGNYASTYYYMLTPYNANGDAVGCTGDTFETAADGCYCTSDPISVDNDGITNITIAGTDFEISPDTYIDNTLEGAIEIGQGLTTSFSITFNTSYSYYTNIWIDWNDNYVFEEGELLYSGESTDDDTSILMGTFDVPADAAMGEHRLRIGTADSGQEDPDPCYSDNYGVTVDFMVNVSEPTCVQPQATATIAADCDNEQYFVNVTVSAIGNGSPFITDGDGVNITVTEPGVYPVGPFENGTSVMLTIQHGTEVMCDLPLGNFTYICPPANDDCAQAIALTVNGDLDCAVVTSATTYGATASEPFDDEITGYADDDVWFSFVAGATGHQVKLLNIEEVIGESTDMGMAVYTGTCGSLVNVDDSDPETLNLSGLTPGTTYYVRVYGWYDDGTRNTFDICIGTTPAPPANDEWANATSLTVDAAFCDGTNNNGTNAGATDSGFGYAECFYFGESDVWYSFVVPEGVATVDISTDFAGGTLVDTEIALYALVDSDLEELACDQDSGETILSNGSSYNSVIFDTPVDEGQLYYVRVSGYSEEEVGSFCIEVSTNQTLSVVQPGMEGLKAYPNPVTDYFTIRNNAPISSITVTNMLGQHILSSAPATSVATLDMSQLSAGTYLVKVESDDKSKTFKVIKR